MNDPLDNLLAAWQPRPEAEPNFAPGVWAKVGSAEPSGWLPFSGRWAVLFVAVAMVLGSGSGLLVGERAAQARAAQEFAASVDPLLIVSALERS